MKIKFIDLFSGIGGTRIGFEEACQSLGIKFECVFSSELKKHAIKVYKKNFDKSHISGDITKISEEEIPNFEFLLAGFPCQAFSSAGHGHGFMDTRGTLFFDIERILKEKLPHGFLLENVEGLIGHDKAEKSDKIGRTLSTILNRLKKIGYNVNYKILDSSDFKVAQKRRRIYIVGSLKNEISLDNFKKTHIKLKAILEKNKKPLDTKFTKLLLSKFDVRALDGKAIKDKRGGENNIHSWDLGLKGDVNIEQKFILEKLLTQRRHKKWAEKKGIVWMDGMPLSLREIKSFCDIKNLKKELDDLCKKGYLRFEHPKEQISIKDQNGNFKKVRSYDKSIEKGYNIVVGKLSFEINKILDRNSFAPTLVATDVNRLAVLDNHKLRRLTVREGLRLFGFPETFTMDNISYNEAFDLLGNTVVVTVIKEIIKRYLISEINSTGF